MSTVIPLDLSSEADLTRWQAYIAERSDTQYADLGHWRRLFAELYGIRSFNFACVDGERVLGVVSLYLITSPFFGRMLVTCPFFGASGGLYADDAETEAVLLDRVQEAAIDARVDFVEFRLRRPLAAPYQASTDFVEMEVALDGSEQHVWDKTLSSNVRQNIRKAEKHGLVFSTSTDVEETFLLISQAIRDLGTPFHSRRFFELLIKHLPNEVQFSHVRHDGRLVAAGVLVRFRDRISTPYIGSDKQFRHTCANYGQYWGIIQHGLMTGARCFDMGRSPRGSTHQQFKQKWGAVEVTPHYSHRSFSTRRTHRSVLERSRFELWACDVWKRVPLAITRNLGHVVIRYIP